MGGKMEDSVKEQTYMLLEKHGYKDIDLELERLQNHVIDKLKKRMKVEAKNPLTGEKHSTPVIDFVYEVQHNMPWKIITLQKIKTPTGDELRFCYYILNYTLLARDGKLQMKYGQYGVNIPIDDYYKLIEKAKQKGMI
jgi:hypothetical protein